MTTARRAVLLQELGIGPRWLRRTPTTATTAATEVRPATAAAKPDAVALQRDRSVSADASPVPVAAMDWEQLQQAVAACRSCSLCDGRIQSVFGVGDRQAKWLFVGEGPGRTEDLRGEPFTGPAGQLLDNMLLAMGLRRGKNAYIANIVKCRPTDTEGRDRRPEAVEIAACMPYLQRQIELIRPAIIVALGKTAAVSLLQLEPATPVASLRGKVHRLAGRPLIVTYHPAYLLRNLADKRKAWADLCLALDTYGSGEH